MFCATLRKRSAFAPGIASLTSAMALREHQLRTHDLEIPFGSGTGSNAGNSTSRRLRVLLLAPPDMAETKVAQTMERTSHFTALTGGEDIVIVFLLYPSTIETFISAKDLTNGSAESTANASGIAAYTKLQIELLDHTEISPPPILLLHKLEGLPDLLKRHVTRTSHPRPVRNSTTTTIDLLKRCTANPPMPEQTALILTDLFTGLRDLAETCSTVAAVPGSSSPSARVGPSQGIGIGESSVGGSSQPPDPATEKLERLQNLVGEQTCADVIDFWREEWIIE